MAQTNKNRSAGNHIIIGTKNGHVEYYNWHADGMIVDKTQATGYHSGPTAKSVAEQLSKEIPGYTWTTENDKPKK